MQVSGPNWAGYAATAPSGTPLTFTSVHGAWREPAVSCGAGDAGTASAIWVGLGGFVGSDPGLEQIGTNANCDARGRPMYFAWFEVLPYIAYPIKAKVRPGDSLAASVSVDGYAVRLQLQNRTRHWTVTKNLSSEAPDTSSAEWIVEAPMACDAYAVRAETAGELRLGVDHERGRGDDVGLPERSTDPSWSLSAIRLAPAIRSRLRCNPGAGLGRRSTRSASLWTPAG